MKLIGSLSLLGLAYATSPTTDRQWMSWKQEHGISFKTVAEEARRFKIFGKTRQFVKDHNARAARGQETYTVELNKYAAMDQAEFLGKYTGQTRDYSEKRVVLEYTCPNQFVWNGNAIPDAVSYVAGESSDVRVTTVKDQGSCGSCWTFGTGAAIEGAMCSAGVQDCNTWTGVSTQQQVDCCSYTPQTSATNPEVNDLNPYDSHGCNGGFQANALRCIVMQGGINSWEDYGYVSGTTQTEGDCAYDASTALLNPISDCGAPAGGDETQLAQAVSQVGPLTIAIDASGLGFQLYSGGVYSSNTCSSTRLNHAVAAVGYGRYLDGQLYWEVKNSWGTGWGSNGYILMARNQNNMCGVASDSQYAIV